jgi:eukaryotic-like serine/threonine-protein kinase
MNPEPLVEAAGLVADGAVLDWGSVTSGLSTDEDRAIADELAMIARVAQGHRQLHNLLPFDSSAKVALDRTAWGDLELLEVLGRGSYGTVYRAWDPRLDRHVALKLFHGPRDPEVVMNEGRMLAKIRHDNVVAVYGADVVDGVAGIWMEFIRGRNLEQIVKDHGPMSASEATLIGLDMARALAAVHGAGLLHCDIKAQNVVREPGGRLVLMDLGASRSVPGADDTTTIGQVSGTPRYMAPELFDRAPASPQSDIYSLGVLLFFLVTGRFPVEGGTLSEIRVAQKQGRRTHLRDLRPELPAGYLREVTRALERSPLARHHSAGELEAGLLSLSAAAAPAPAVPVPARTPFLRMVPMLIALAAVVAAGVLAWRINAPTASSPAARSIAVLPIRNLTGDSSKNYLADGLTEVLISNLARVRALRVPSFSAVLPFRDSSEPSRTIAEKLGAHILLAGSVTTSGDSVRLGVQLIDPATDTVQWSEELTRPASELLSAQAEIARLVAGRLAITLSPAEQRGLAPRSVDARAQDAYLRGLAEAHTFLSSRGPVAAQYFRQATEIEPGFAAAWAELALTELGLIELSTGTGDRGGRAARVTDLATRAMQLDPSLPNAYAALGSVQFYHDWDFAAAERTFQRGVEVGPSAGFMRQRYAMLLASLGRLHEAIPMATEARELEPLVASRASSLGILYYYRRDFPAAIAEMERALNLVPDFLPGHFGLGRIYAALGRYDDAIASIERSVAKERIGAYVVELARVHAAAGHVAESEALMRELEELRAAGEGFSLDNYAYIAAARGRIDEAFEILNRAVDQKLTNTLWIAVDPRVDPLRSDPRFDQLLARMGLRP